MKVTAEEYEEACKQVAGIFPTIASYLQQELESRVFTMSEEEFPVFKTKHQYLDEMVSLINNISTAEEK